MALAILSALDASELVLCIQNNQLNTLTKVPGIGRKTAERLLVEMRDRITLQHGNNAETLADTRAAAVSSATAPTLRTDAESALLALGYKPQEAEKMVRAVLKEQTVSSSEELIRLALKQMLAR
jgi:Holliday junction DNA helicase RuvA